MKWRNYTVRITHATSKGLVHHTITVRAIGGQHAAYCARRDNPLATEVQVLP